MRLGRSASFAASAAAVTLLLGACSGGGGGDEGGEEKKLADIPAVDINKTDRAEIKDGGTFNWGINEYPTQYNLEHVDGNLANVQRIAASVMPRPMVYNESGDFSPNTPYLEEAEVSEDGLEIHYKLNPDAEWSNGDPITWEDYEAQAETLSGGRKDDKKYKIGDKSGYELIDKVVKGADEYEFTLEMKSSYGEWPLLFEILYPKKYMEDPEEFNKGYEKDFPVTAGPFGDVEFDDTAETVTVNKSDDWWGEPAKLDSIIFHSYANDALSGVYNNDEIDGYYLGYEAADYELLKDKEGSRITEAIDNAYRHMTFNGGEGQLLEQVEVRNALVHGIDRAQMASATLGGVEWTTDPTANRLLRSTQTGFKDNSKGYGEYDPEKAAEMLDEAGWTLKEGDEVRTNEDGDELTLNWVIPSDLQNTADEAEIAKSQLAEINVGVDINSVPNNSFFTEYVIPGNYDATTYVLVGTSPYSGDSAENFTGPHGEDEDGKPVWGNNLTFTSTEGINKGFEDLVAETDPEKYAEIANEIDRMLWEQSMAVPLFQRPGTFAVNEKLANWGANGLSSIIYEDIGWTE
ncbi:ABC transporter family substrate-binding protein [Nocardiopsis sp. CNT-189]|uniref:ABC transporter family substrate-binding protein n=1 Tax=Nocardiopsis oceanisediminis TaxID=2816862 RepID=UPI003B30A112